MNRLTRAVGRFLLLFALALGVLTPLWSIVAPHYAGLAARAARPVFHAVEAADVTVVDARDGDVWIFRRLDGQRISPFLVFDRFTLFAAIPLIALFVATPGLGVLRRLVRTLVGLGVLFALQVGYLVAAVELGYAAAGLAAGEGVLSATSEGWQVLVRVLWEAGPVAIWIALSAGAWRRLWGELRAPNGSRGEWTRGVAAAGGERGSAV
ncbi:MAG: hypothetical protein PHW86_04160 [Candidatus Bipolaricaulis sp.]|nr:hypothetical protein [Candidatus Bipolaricaulis sp.]